MPCTFPFRTAVAMLPRQPSSEHLNKRTVFDLPPGEGGYEDAQLLKRNFYFYNKGVVKRLKYFSGSITFLLKCQTLDLT